MASIGREDVASLGTILGIWAHPDDESYLTAGIMAAASQAGSRVVCITATRGEAGSQDEKRWPSAGIASVRERELERSLEILGISEHHWLDYVDGHCSSAAASEAVGKLEALIDGLRPDTVLTFGPDGQTNHPDHKAVHRWTVGAVQRLALPHTRLMYAAVTREWHDQHVPYLSELNVFEPGTPVPYSRETLSIHFVLDDELWDLKLRALKAQESQTQGFFEIVGDDYMRTIMTEEMFVAADL